MAPEIPQPLLIIHSDPERHRYSKETALVTHFIWFDLQHCVRLPHGFSLEVLV